MTPVVDELELVFTRQDVLVFDVEISLHAVSHEFDEGELRAFYKGSETPTLDLALGRSPSLRLGFTEVVTPDNQWSRGPVGRVDDLLSLKGAESSPPQLPLLDEALKREMLAAFDPRPSDPTFESAPSAELERFLSDNLGRRLATKSKVL